jgi:hypothetical protein
MIVLRKNGSLGRFKRPAPCQREVTFTDPIRGRSARARQSSARQRVSENCRLVHLVQSCGYRRTRPSEQRFWNRSANRELQHDGATADARVERQITRPSSPAGARPDILEMFSRFLTTGGLGVKHIAEFARCHAHVPCEDGCEVAVRKPNRFCHLTYRHASIMQ